jgi:hypothetical protein
MRISESPGYHGRRDGCGMQECRRNYCPIHRLLWSDCETVIRGIDDYYLNGRPHYFYELGECPECERLGSAMGNAPDIGADYPRVAGNGR